MDAFKQVGIARLRKFGAAAFLFFLVKGLLWLAAAGAVATGIW